ncbi:serine protease persephone isoform X3 [Drosophila busckii]|uniref:serine protease persephone isoform X3 n=1 Tax=Drosophila busckii TaxID=30019 RepID=UPI00083F228A|nr:serine protease persephone isoform X3 [Drosophila busckii]
MALINPLSNLNYYAASLLICALMLCQLEHSEAREEGDSCIVKENMPGICRLSSKCEPHIEKYIKSGRLSQNEVPSCGFGPREEIVCCPVAECCDDEDTGTTSTTTTTTTTTTVRALPATPTTRVDTGAMEERPAVRACRKIEARDKVESITYQILGGLPVDPGVYPHMAAIAFSNFGSFSYRCGGTLISNRHVLTAAHCVNSQNDTPVHVRLGSVNIENLSSYYQDIAVTDNIVVHPDYVSSTKYHDIAILELEHEVNLTYYVYPACLDASASDPPTNSQLYVAGWGVMNQTTRRTSKVLLRAPLSVVPLSQCNEAYLEQPNSKRFLPNGLIPSLLCAADKLQQKADACQGDSGGPLVLEEDIVNHKYSIVGVISAGFGCATKTPGLYTRVSSYLDFIESVVWPNNVV